MSKSRRPTLEHAPAVTVVVIGGPDALVDATRQAVSDATPARIALTDVANAATKVAAARPFAIVISEELYQFDSGEFDALARDVRAEVIAARTDGVPQARIQADITPKLLTAYRKLFSR